MRCVALSVWTLTAALTVCAAADRAWQMGTLSDVTTKRRMVDFGPGASGFGRPGGGTTPQMRAMADVRLFVIETEQLRLEAEDTVPIGRRSLEAEIGGKVTFAIEKNNVYVRTADGTEHRLRLIKKSDRDRAETARGPAYGSLGGGHVLRGVTDGGRYVTLEDGSRWEVAARDQYQTAEWEASANITVRGLSRAENGFYYELINTTIDEGAVANYVQK
jgi:hypothetical protein